MTSRVGEQIGNYRLLRLLGVGGFTEVYLGEHRLLRTQAAIKIPYQNQLPPDVRHSIINELKILSSLSHPHIIRLFDANINETVPYLVMEYAPNGTLYERHARDSLVPLETILHYIKQIAAGLQYAHVHNVVHRDIKPENLILNKNNDVLVSGFGLAMVVDSSYSRKDQEIAGTAMYMSPEQFDGKANFAIDQYALAIVTYEWLCGEVPFQGDFMAVFYQHKYVMPPPLREKNPSIPKAVEDVVMKALSKEPNDRYVNITAFAEAFERAATGKVVGGIGELFGPYRTTRLLGQGDMGKVYFAEASIQQSDGTWRKQSVAVKVLHNWYDEDIFRNHARKMTKLQHTNILSTLLFGVKDDIPYLVMQYSSQGTLLARHPRGTILALETILSYIKQIASALQYAHERDMVGNVRSKKIFIGQDNRILMSGFDIAFNVGASLPGRGITQNDVYMMTYSAPEFAVRGKATSSGDQYSLAIIVYEWLSGDVPFQGELMQIALQHLEVTPPSLREQNPSIPHEVEEVVMKALAKDPEKRYESIQDFAEALEEATQRPTADRFVLPDRSGEQFGQYRLERLLGTGGFAEVYLGKHIKLDTFTAIKVLHTRLSAKELEAFEKEAKVIASLRHPSIVRVLDYNAQGNIPFLVMDHAPEGTMRQFHARGSRLSLPTVVKYVKQIAEALQFAHNKKIIHRDVKPENMLIESQDIIMLSDFGLAVIAHSSRSARQQDKAGTAQYMAPEQFRGKPVPASDQYSLAVTAYEWLCGAPPFDEGNEIQLGFQHTMEPVPPMSERGAVVSEEVERVILKALAKEPAERFGSVKEFAEALEKAAQVE